MSETADTKIAEILKKYGEPLAGNIWRVQGQAVIYHKTLERIAAQAGIAFDPPQVLRAERDEAVILVTGRLGDRSDWSIGEAVINVNYRVSGRQAAYVYAMSEKRAKDRVILKLIGLHGLLYSEEEADDLGKGKPSEDDARPNGAEPVKSSAAAKREGMWLEIKRGIAACRDSAELLEWGHTAQTAIGVSWKDETQDAWGKALAARLVEECHSPAEVAKWALELRRPIEALPPEWINTARAVCKEHLEGLKRAAQPMEALP